MFISPRACVADAAVPLLTICRDDDVGLCVRALHDCAAGAVVEVFDGAVGPDLSQHSLQVRPGLHISDTRHIGFLSHGCDPNCRLDMERFELVTLRPVSAGELLTVDYAATEDRLFTQFACACGAGGCRQWITGRKEPVNPAGERYLAGLAASPV